MAPGLPQPSPRSAPSGTDEVGLGVAELHRCQLHRGGRLTAGRSGGGAAATAVAHGDLAVRLADGRADVVVAGLAHVASLSCLDVRRIEIRPPFCRLSKLVAAWELCRNRCPFSKHLAYLLHAPGLHRADDRGRGRRPRRPTQGTGGPGPVADPRLHVRPAQPGSLHLRPRATCRTDGPDRETTTLKRLEAAGLLTKERRGMSVHYRVVPRPSMPSRERCTSPAADERRRRNRCPDGPKRMRRRKGPGSTQCGSVIGTMVVAVALTTGRQREWGASSLQPGSCLPSIEGVRTPRAGGLHERSIVDIRSCPGDGRGAPGSGRHHGRRDDSDSLGRDHRPAHLHRCPRALRSRVIGRCSAEPQPVAESQQSAQGLVDERHSAVPRSAGPRSRRLVDVPERECGPSPPPSSSAVRDSSTATGGWRRRARAHTSPGWCCSILSR